MFYSTLIPTALTAIVVCAAVRNAVASQIYADDMIYLIDGEPICEECLLDLPRLFCCPSV